MTRTGEIGVDSRCFALVGHTAHILASIRLKRPQLTVRIRVRGALISGWGSSLPLCCSLARSAILLSLPNLAACS